MNLLARLHLLTRADKLQPLRDFVRELAHEQGCDKENLECMVMAVNEACMNVMQHAYGGDQNEEIVVEFWREGNELMIRILDDAEQVELKTIQSRDLEDIRPGGLGVHIIHQVMDSVEYKHQDGPRGNMLEMRKNLNKPISCCSTAEE